jgi:hypothetical protein
VVSRYLGNEFRARGPISGGLLRAKAERSRPPRHGSRQTCPRSEGSSPENTPAASSSQRVYLVPSHAESVARFAATEKKELELGIDGTTAIGQGLVCSEVYVRQNSASDIALIVAHEALHNKLRLDNVRLHAGKQRGSLALKKPAPN